MTTTIVVYYQRLFHGSPLIEINMLFNRSVICQGLGVFSLLMMRVLTKLELLIVTWLFLNTLIIEKHEDTLNVLQEHFNVVDCLKEEIGF